MKRSLYIIDGHAHIYAAYYAPMRRSLTAPNGDPIKATYIFTNLLLGMIEKYQPDMLVVTMDSKVPSFRTKIYKEYKAHRPPMPEDMPSQIDKIENILQTMKIPVLRIDGWEADDIIGTLAKKYGNTDNEVFICSKDKDMLQLLNSHVKMLDVKTGKITDEKVLLDEQGVTPQQFIDVLGLMGDKADNIPGIPDVGPKTALEWIKKYGSIDGVYENADEIKGKRGTSLRDNKDNAYLSKELVVINCQAPIDIDYDQFALKEPDKEKLIQVFTELGFNSFLKNLGASASAPQRQQNKKPAQASLFDATESGPINELNNINNTKHEYILIDDQKKFEKFYSELKKQKLFTFDTETTSTSPMRAELVGISFAFQSHKAYYLPIRGPLGAKTLDIKFVRDKLSPIMADENIKKIGQNIKYDLLIMHNASMHVKGVYFDTMVASYCLAAQRRSHSMDNMAADYLKYECVPISDLIGKGRNQRCFDEVDTANACEYAAEDADITLQLYQYLQKQLDANENIKKLFYELEMPLVEVLADMEINGVSIDIKVLKGMSTDINNDIEDISEKIFELAGERFNIDSPKQLGEILFDKLGLQSIKKGKAGRSTDASVLEQLSEEHNIAALVLEYRMLAKLKNTYVDKLGAIINPKTNRVHASFNQTITITGRLSSSDPNLQNIPIRTELGRKIRSAFVPEKDTDVILSADYSQIELRLLAHFSGDAALKKAFADDMDIHSFVASQIYDVPLEKVDSEMRSHSKAVNFGIIYGQGPHGLSRTTGLSYADAKKFIEDYFNRYASIKDFMDATVKTAKRTGFAETILGRRRNIDGLSAKNFNVRSQAERLVINTTIQGSAADLIKKAMINIQDKITKAGLAAKMILQIHDELVFELAEKDVKKVAHFIKYEMENAIKLDVPLKVDMNWGKSWMK